MIIENEDVGQGDEARGPGQRAGTSFVGGCEIRASSARTQEDLSQFIIDIFSCIHIFGEDLDRSACVLFLDPGHRGSGALRLWHLLAEELQIGRRSHCVVS